MGDETVLGLDQSVDTSELEALVSEHGYERDYRREDLQDELLEGTNAVFKKIEGKDRFSVSYTEDMEAIKLTEDYDAAITVARYLDGNGDPVGTDSSLVSDLEEELTAREVR